MNLFTICLNSFLSTLFLFVFSFSLLAQDRSDISSSLNKDLFKAALNHKDNNEINYSKKPINCYTTDEYGSLTYNAVLSGLGSSGSCANIAHSSLFNQDIDGSFELWVYPTTINVNAILVSKGNSSSQSFLWGISSSTKQMFFRIGTTVFNNSDGTVIPLSTWTHLAVTWTGGPNFSVIFYVNGAQSGSTVINNAAFNLNSDPLRIGASQYFTSEYFAGQIDEVRFWADVRTVQEIRDNRFVGLGDGSGANASSALTSSAHYDNLIASWTFNRTGTVYDDINGLNGNYYGSAVSSLNDLGVPVPYNLALRCFGGVNDKVVIAHNSTVFDQTGDGSLEMWFKPVTLSIDQILMSKGSTISTISFLFGVNNTGRLYFRLGGNPIASNGASLTNNMWQHVAVTWLLVSGNYEIKFYLNGVQNGTTLTLPGVWPTNTARAYIGGSEVFVSNTVQGYIDEVRIWNPTLTQAQIQKYMFVSGRALLPNSEIRGIWNFDGNLLNFSAFSGVNGSFNLGAVNNARLSAYNNEGSPGSYSTSFIAHSTVINRGGTPNSFPNGFYISTPFLSIPDNNTTGVTNTISVTNNPGNLSNIELFLSVQHTWVGDLVVTLTAPNGQSRQVIANNGGAGDNILSFFGDAFNYLPNSSIYLPPWAFIKPIVTFGNIGNTFLNGTWSLKVVDNAASDVGLLQGWGLRFNNQTMVGIEIVNSNIPQKFALYQNYPNPFNPNTSINFDVAKNGNVKIILFDVLGREVKTLVNEYFKAGNYKYNFDGFSLASGVYFYKIVAGDFTDTKKMTLLK